jgi:hypothetical protein
MAHVLPGEWATRGKRELVHQHESVVASTTIIHYYSTVFPIATEEQKGMAAGQGRAVPWTRGKFTLSCNTELDLARAMLRFRLLRLSCSSSCRTQDGASRPKGATSSPFAASPDGAPLVKVDCFDVDMTGRASIKQDMFK